MCSAARNRQHILPIEVLLLLLLNIYLSNTTLV